MNENEKRILKVNILEFMNGNTYINNKNKAMVDILMHVNSLFVARTQKPTAEEVKNVLKELVNEGLMKEFKVGTIDTYAITSEGKKFLKKLYDE